MAPMFGLTPEQFAEHPHALIGSVDSICDAARASAASGTGSAT